MMSSYKYLNPFFKKKFRPFLNNRVTFSLTASTLFVCIYHYSKVVKITQRNISCSKDDMSNTSMKSSMINYILDLQSNICNELSRIDGADFIIDNWTKDDVNKGFGKTCVLQNGNCFEKAGVNTSIIKGKLPKQALMQMKSKLGEIDTEKTHEFFVASISLVIHAHNPFVPTIHLNYRYFELKNIESNVHYWWFGGGSDLTPFYIIKEDIIHFHKTLKNAIEKHSKDLHPKFKKWCDEYFYLKHREESRGVGGIFFDDLTKTNNLNTNQQDNVFELIKSLGDSFIESYLPIVTKNKEKNYTNQQKEWSQTRKGRYVEFNLLFDRGTKFGLLTPNANIEAILVSLPLNARWEYKNIPKKGSEEQRLLDILKTPIDWV